MYRLTVAVSVSLSAVAFCASTALAQARTSAEPRTGEQIFRSACAACHGPDGKGQSKTILGFEPPASFPDFTDCAVSSVEPNVMWQSVVHLGGRARGLSHIMPAFDDILSDEEIERVVEYLHSLCAEPRWPRGDLNFPRSFFTEKAFPENETVITVSAATNHPHGVETRIDYEHRIGKRAQYELGAPVEFQQTPSGSWNRGLGDINFAYKYSLFDNIRRGSVMSAGAEVTLPTGKETEGLGEGVRIYEAFALFGQRLPGYGFFQIHTGFERPADHDIASDSFYWRAAVGKTFAQNRWGRAWSPMVEVLGAKERVEDARAEWDLVPQMQVTLSVFQHVRMNVGLRLPVNERETRRKTFVTYFLWDWFDGGLFELWRAH